MTAVAVATALETSALMQSSGFVDAVTIGATAFLGDLLVGDALAVTDFGAQGRVDYPAAGGLVVVDQTLSQLTAATAAVQALTFTSPTIDIGAGLQCAYGVFTAAPAGALPGVLLISSGQQSVGGTDPLKLASYQPTSVCAPGPSANATLLAQIAALSRGQYYYAPTAGDMQTILNQVRATRPGWSMALNQASTVSPLGFWLPPVTLAAGLAQAQFSVVWENAAISFTNSPNPGPGQVSVTLVQPPGITLVRAPSALGAGYCVFDLPAPIAAGQWYVQVMYGGAAPLPMTVGVFVRPGAQGLPTLSIETQTLPQAGRALGFQLTLHDELGPVQVTSAVVEIVSPRPDGPAPHQRRAFPLIFADGATAVVAAAERAAPGSHTLKAHVRGISAAGPFEVSRLTSVHVPD